MSTARTTPLVANAMDEYLGTRLHLAKNTQTSDRSVLSGFAKAMGNIQIGNLTPQHVEAYFHDQNGIYHRMNEGSHKTRFASGWMAS